VMGRGAAGVVGILAGWVGAGNLTVVGLGDGELGVVPRATVGLGAGVVGLGKGPVGILRGSKSNLNVPAGTTFEGTAGVGVGAKLVGLGVTAVVGLPLVVSVKSCSLMVDDGAGVTPKGAALFLRLS